MRSDRSSSNCWPAYLFTVLGCVLTVVLRWVPHPANFTAMGAVGLFAGAKIRGWQAYVFSLGTLVLSDVGLWLITGFDPNYSLWHTSRLYVYVSFLLYVAIGRFLQERSAGWLVGASLLGSLQFFVISNLGVWLAQPYQANAGTNYSRDFAGVLECFAAALPFYKGDVIADLHAFAISFEPGYGIFGTFLGDLLCSLVLFGLYGLVASVTRQPSMEPALVTQEQA